ncbi:MAG: 16S rRNA (cytosine(1402)-N(4))-methyltransferase RsmH [Bradymonadales bacterium]|nr:16S rRNA (cytosine(1402)-N(4))-methyltransferase RsmH [Bradymonadales bacterium]
MAFVHEAVLTDQVIRYLACRPGCHYVDATIGSGAHGEAILQASAPTGRLLGVDVDPEAIEAARIRLERYQHRTVLVRARYGRLAELLEEVGFGEREGSSRRVDGIVADLGVSSPQLDTPGRGFSFLTEGPLDMRMSKEGQCCAELIDSLDEDGLRTILRRFGEVPQAARLARAIKRERREGRLESTLDLARLVERLAGARQHRRIHPATLVFQALRIAVNRELEDLQTLCDGLTDLLRVGGVGVFLSFHSLEDRIVKRSLIRQAQGKTAPPGVPLRADQLEGGTLEILTRAAVRPEASEIEANPRARSARLRAARRRAG